MNEASPCHFDLMLKRLEPLQEELFIVDTKIQDFDVTKTDNVYINDALSIIQKLYESIASL